MRIGHLFRKPERRDPLAGIVRVIAPLRANAAARCDMQAVKKLDEAIKLIRTEALKPAPKGAVQ